MPDCSAHYIEIKSVSVILNKYSFVDTIVADMNKRRLASFIGEECGLTFPPNNVTVVWPNLNLQLKNLVNLDRTFEVSVNSLFDLIGWKYHQEVNLTSVIFTFCIRLLYHMMFSTWNKRGADLADLMISQKQTVTCYLTFIIGLIQGHSTLKYAR